MDIIETIKPYDGILENDHFVYASGAHGSAWINKDALTPHADLMQLLVAHLAEDILAAGVECDAIAGPAMGGVFIAQWLGLFLERPAVYFERQTRDKSSPFECHRGFGELIKDARVLLVDDVINTGFSLRQCKSLVEQHGGQTVAVACLIDRGNIAVDHFGCPLLSLATYNMPSWPAEQCPLCQQGVLINTDMRMVANLLASMLGAIMLCNMVRWLLSGCRIGFV